MRIKYKDGIVIILFCFISFICMSCEYKNCNASKRNEYQYIGIIEDIISIEHHSRGGSYIIIVIDGKKQLYMKSNLSTPIVKVGDKAFVNNVSSNGLLYVNIMDYD